MELKRFLKNPRIILLIIFLIFSLVAIHPNPWNEGATIRGVLRDSPAYAAGIEGPKPTASPMSRERIISINNIPIKDASDYFNILSTLSPNITVQLKTNKRVYRVIPEHRFEIVTLNETTIENITREIFNETTNKTVNVSEQIERPKKIKKYFENESVDLGIIVYDAPKTNLRKGLDIEGGTRVLLKPETDVSEDTLNNIISSMEQRLNVYGISDVTIRPATDLSGNKFIRVEIAGATEEEVKNLLASQGKFEAKIGNRTVFIGGRNDITYVCRTAECSGIDPSFGCRKSGEQWICRFRFSIAISPDAAARQAAATKGLQIITKEGGEPFLNETLDLYLDDQLVDSLNIGADLKGRAITEIAISGSGIGISNQDAINNALENMKGLQTILITGSLPTKLNIEKIDAISPTLGKEFSKSILIMVIVASVGIILVILIKYRVLKIVVPITITLLSEIVILLGIASLIRWNIDIASIAGIIVAIGTGIDDQIVITDETLRKGAAFISWKERFKRAFFIIFAAYFTSLAAMIPLFFVGAGLLKGFAITTIIGISVGVFITRPAYSAMIEQILKERET